MFGFKVINPTCGCSYKTKYKDIMNKDKKCFIDSKLKKELEYGYVNKSNAPALCVHNLFTVPKVSGRGHRTIVDRSKPVSESVNKFVGEVAKIFSYLGVDHLEQILIHSQFIKDA